MSRWIEFIRAYALKNNLSYGCAISQPNVAYEYHKKYNTAKYQQMRKAGIESESFDEALPSEAQVKKPINLKIKQKKAEETDVEEIRVKRITIDGKKYLREISNNILYDEETQEEVGFWNPDTKKIISTRITPKPKPERTKKKKDDSDEEEIKVKKIEIDGKKYLIDKSNNDIYDFVTQKKIGSFNPNTKKIDLFYYKR